MQYLFLCRYSICSIYIAYSVQYIYLIYAPSYLSSYLAIQLSSYLSIYLLTVNLPACPELLAELIQ